MRKLFVVLASLFLLAGQVFAQNRTITGKVADAKGEPVPNASVVVKGSNVGTTTKADGSFTISVPATAKTLIISSVGFVPQEFAIGSRTSIDATLKAAEDKGLQEVIVVGYQQRRKIDEAGAISSIKGKDIANLPNPSVDKALQGRAAGVLVQANNGIPGGNINVRIRGTGSIQAGNQPLYVVDGVQLNTRNDASFTQSNPLAFLNPNDIESIDVLKDAASAAIYGAQASNGVVIITTKKGRAGKTRFTFNSYVGVAMPLKKLDVLNSQEWYQMRSEAVANFNNVPIAGTGVKQLVLGELRVPGAATLTDAQADAAAAALPTFDWQDAAFAKGTIKNYELSASGGSDKTTFYASASYNGQSAILNKVDFKRTTFKLDLTQKVNERASFSTSINLSSFTQQIPFATDGSFLGSPAFSSALILPSNPIYNPDGTYFGLPPIGIAGILNQNIIAVNDFNQGFQRTNQAVGNISLDYKITNWLTFRSFYGLDYRLVQGKQYRDPRTNDAFARRGLANVQSNWNTNFLTTQTLNYNTTFGEKHRLDGVVGLEYRREANESITASGDGFPSFQFTTLNAAANPVTVGEFYTGFKRYGGFGAANYSYDGRYLLSFVLRYDGSSRFGTDNQYGAFPSVKAAWNVSEEGFMQQSKVFSELRIRASYGQTGNDQIGNFDALGLYGAGSVYNGAAGISPTSLPNPTLKWERNITTNVGVDFALFKGRISGTVDLYRKENSALLLNQPVQWTSGFGSFTSNVGRVENKGIELLLSVSPLRSASADGFRWTSTFNFTYNKNTVKSLYSGLKILPSDNSVQVGQPLGTIFITRYGGVNPATGRPIWLDTLGNATYRPQARDRVIIGDTEPDFWGGLNNTFQYKGFTLDVFFQYEYGRTQTDGQVNFMIENGNRTFNTLQEVYDGRWQKPGDIVTYPRAIANGAEQQGSNHAIGSSRLWRKADYVRLKNLTMSYDLKSEFTRKMKINNARLYVQATNLWTYDDWQGYDPEFVGTATGIVPQSKNITVGIQIGF
jgi:TonB-dependent starch-binding outer membrane protein SusC